jgi:hypothetical protein
MGECLPRRVPPDARKRIATIVDKMTPGSSTKAPTKTIGPTDLGIYDNGPWIPPTLGGGTGLVQFYYDHWTLTGEPQTFTLTHTPMRFSEHVYWQGIEQQVGVDYTLDGTTLNVLAAMGPEEDDLLEVRYAFMTAASVEATTWDAPTFIGADSIAQASTATSITVPLPSGILAGSVLLVTAWTAGGASWPAGWTRLRAESIGLAGATSMAMETRWKIATGPGEPDPTVTAGSTTHRMGISAAWNGAISASLTDFGVSFSAIPDSVGYSVLPGTPPWGRSSMIRVMFHQRAGGVDNSHAIALGNGTPRIQENGHRASLGYWETPVEEPGTTVAATVADPTSPGAGGANGEYTVSLVTIRGGNT